MPAAPEVADVQPRRRSVGYVLLLASVAALGGLLFGYDTAVIAGAIDYLEIHFRLGPGGKGWAVSNVLVGCMFGAALAGTFSDGLGRKKALLLAAGLFAVSAVGSAVPRNLTELVAARFVGGFGVGIASMLSPLYIAEVSPAHLRGRLVSLNQITIITGMVVVSVVNWWIARTAHDEAWNVATGWRWMFASETLPAVLFLICLLFVPESPWWLVKQGRPSEALAILTRTGGRDRAEWELEQIREAVAHERGSLGELSAPGMRMALVVAVVLAVLQQVTGINAVLYYAPTIFKASGTGVTATQALLQTAALQVVNLAFTLVAIRVVDRAGRRPLLLATSVAMGTSLALLGAGFALKLAPGWIFLFTLGYVASFAIAMGPVVWVVLAEIFPTRIRGRAMSVAVVALWIACFAVSQSVPWMFKRLGEPITFWSYGLMCLVAFVFVLRYVPETKGKTLEQIEQTWRQRASVAEDGGPGI
ncbi:MAG TPA: MFS transporter [Planctomycetes bacterium]|nr:MFS transporter [Planctomycetota bacterium]